MVVELAEIPLKIVKFAGMSMAVVLTAAMSLAMRLSRVNWLRKGRAVTDVVVIRALIKIFKTRAIVVVLESRF
jgi:hypothetical protein